MKSTNASGPPIGDRDSNRASIGHVDHRVLTLGRWWLASLVIGSMCALTSTLVDGICPS
jgi:hypothetical protein